MIFCFLFFHGLFPPNPVCPIVSPLPPALFVTCSNVGYLIDMLSYVGAPARSTWGLSRVKWVIVALPNKYSFDLGLVKKHVTINIPLPIKFSNK